MEKIIYWLKKLGILRTGIFTAKGDAKDVVEMQIKGELYQSDKEIEEEFAQKSAGKEPQKKDKKKTIGKVTFWIFVVIGIFFVLAFWGGGWTFWKFVCLCAWGIYLRWMWIHITEGFFAIGKILVFGAIVVVASLIFATPDESENVGSMDNGVEKTDVKSDTVYMEDDVDDDYVVKFLHELDLSTGLNFSKIQNDDIVWTGGPGLRLQKAKSFTAEDLSPQDFDKLQKFFLDLGANDGGIGFTFEPPAGTKSAGFALVDQEYSGLMCVLIGIDNDGVLVGCGWGPTNNPNSK